MSLKDKAIQGFSWNFVQQIGNAGVQFVVQILILSRIITPEELGLFSIIYFFNIISNVVSDSGMGQSLIRGTDLEDDDYGTVFTSNLGISIILYLLIMMISPFVADRFNEPEIPKLLSVYCLSIILTAFSTIQVYKLTKNLDFRKQALIQVPSVFIGGVVGVTLGYMGYGIWALVLMALVKDLCLSLQYWFLTGWRPKFLFSKEKFKIHFDFGYKLSLSTLLLTLTNNVLPLIIGDYYTKAQSGFYKQANDMVSFPMSTLTSVLGKVSYPIFNEVKEEAAKIKNTFRRIQSVAVYLIGGLMFCFAATAKPLIMVAVGDTWINSTPYFQLLCLSAVLFPVNMYNLNILKVYGKSDKYLLANVITKVEFILAVFLTARFGIIPMIMSIIFSNIFAFVVNVYFCSKHIDYSLKQQAFDVIKALIPSALAAFVVLFAGDIIDFNKYIDLIILLIMYVVLVITFSALLKNSAFIEFRNLILSRLKKS